MVSIQTGLKSKQCGLAKDLDALAKQWATRMACLQMNCVSQLTKEFWMAE